MQKEEFNTIITNIEQLNSIDADELRTFTEKYPYFQLPYILLAKKLYAAQSPYFDDALHKASVYAYNRERLFYFIEKIPLNKIPVPAGEIHDDEIEDQDSILLDNALNNAQHEEEIKKEQKDSTFENKLKVVKQDEELKQQEILTDTENKIQDEDTSPEKNKQETPHEDITETKITSGEKISENKQEPVILQVPPDEDAEKREMINAEVLYPLHEHAEDVSEKETDKQKTEKEIEAETKETPPAVSENISDIKEQPVFEYAPYEMELLHETSKMENELDNIVTDIKQQMQKEQFDELKESDLSGEHTFIEWLKITGSESKGKVVEMKPENVPVNVQVISDENKNAFSETDAQILANKSVEKDNNLITETLAKILVMQGKTNNAIEVYEALRLKYPEKSAYFASKIYELKK